MKLASLCSGGKDSSYALWLASEDGHEIEELVAMIPEREDSWMFHRPDVHIMELFSESADLPLKIGRTSGEKEDELLDLKSVLKTLSVEGLVHGAVASKYQKKRIERLCQDLDLVSLDPLWKMDPLGMLRDMLECGFEVIITSVSAAGFDEDWLGRRIDGDCVNDLKELHEEFGIHISGEGGEYETLVLDAPFFEKRIDIVKANRIWNRDRGYLEVSKAELVQK